MQVGVLAPHKHSLQSCDFHKFSSTDNLPEKNVNISVFPGLYGMTLVSFKFVTRIDMTLDLVNGAVRVEETTFVDTFAVETYYDAHLQVTVYYSMSAVPPYIQCPNGGHAPDMAFSCLTGDYTNLIQHLEFTPPRKHAIRTGTAARAVPYCG